MRFSEALEACLLQIPRGRVATCGAIAHALGDVRAARAVAEWLSEHPGTPNAHRIVRADGRPIVGGARPGLEAEGVGFSRDRVAAGCFVEALPTVPLLRELRREQLRLAEGVEERPLPRPPEVLGGVDVAYEGNHAHAVAVALEAGGLEPLEIVEREGDVDFPYVPSYLAFREFPAVESAVRGLHNRPDVLFIDGHGRLHPALFGFACFAGVRLDLPTIGIAKHLLAGTPLPGQRDARGAIPIEIDGAVRGCAWTPPRSARPVYVSIGHRVTLEESVQLTLAATRERYPEPLRLADRLSKEKKRKKNAEETASGRTA